MKKATGRPGIRDVAERAGVSLSSVSRVLDNHPAVSEVMRNRVLDAVAALGYRPDPVAQSMRTGNTMTIGFIAGDTSNPVLSRIAVAAESRLRTWGYSMLVANSANDPRNELRNIELLLNRRVDGLMLSVGDESDEALRSVLAGMSTPGVLIDRSLPGTALAAVHSDHSTGITAAVEDLIRLGHRHVALINGNPRVRPSRERAAALRKAFKSVPHGTAKVVNGAFSERHGYEATLRLLEGGTSVTALIAGSNQILVGVLRALRQLNLQIPEDISVVTCDQSPVAELHLPRISTISRDPSALGTAAADLLHALIQGEQGGIRVLPTVYEPYDSTSTTRKAA